MRRDPFSVGSYVHVIKRGARGSNIVRDDLDRHRFLKLLRYLNDANVPRNWERDVTREHIDSGFKRPAHWPEADPYVSVLSFCLMDNHFHLLLKENVEGGVSKFMQRLCTSMSAYFNARHKERGTLFQGAYRARTADSDVYLQYVSAYIQVKNVFERYPAGPVQAAIEYERAFEWAAAYEFASLGDFAGRSRGLLDEGLIADIMPTLTEFRRFSRDVILGRHEREIEYLRRILE